MSIGCDVLVVGGGVLGLWLLKRLRAKGYEALLVERNRLGTRQTCHSHVFLHQGFAYWENKGMGVLQQGSQAWEQWAQQQINPPVWTAASHHAFQGQMFQSVQKLAPQLPQFNVVGGIPGFANAPTLGGGILQTNERWIPADWAMEQLQNEHPAECGQIADVASIALNAADDEAATVTVRDLNQATLDFAPKAVILASGRHNEDLVGKIRWTNKPTIDKLQYTSDMEMMLLRADAADLPAFNGSINGLVVGAATVNLFIVSRDDPSGQRVWLMTGRGGAGKLGFNLAHNPADRWLLLQALQASLRPNFANDRANWKWAIYDAPLTQWARAKRDLAANTHTQVGGVKNLWIAYTDRLTTAPLVADDLVAVLAAKGHAPSGAAPAVNLAAQLPVQQEYWKEQQYLDWATFEQRHL